MSNGNEEKKQVIEKTVGILKEIAFDRKVMALRILGVMITSMMKKIYTAVKVNEQSLGKVSKVKKSFIISSTKYEIFILAQE